MNWNFDDFMNRYDNLVRQNALLTAEKNTWMQKYNSANWELGQLRDRIILLNQELDTLKYGSEGNKFLEVARKVYSENPDLNKIEMIKQVRSIMGHGLKEAKEAIEQVRMENGKNIYHNPAI
ncbi:MAG: hypothetical protein EB127_07620 [Alphaproteobacteria bacterium]|nr:hypothetical protein [Alphaproteobacteria bacterium]